MKTRGHPLVGDEGQQQGEDLGLDRDVERGRRLVGDEQAWATGQRHRDGDALPLAAGELMGVAVDDRLGIGQPDAGGLDDRPLPGLAAAQS